MAFRDKDVVVYSLGPASAGPMVPAVRVCGPCLRRRVPAGWRVGPALGGAPTFGGTGCDMCAGRIFAPCLSG